MPSSRSVCYLVANTVLWCGLRLIPDDIVRRDILKLFRLYDAGHSSPERACALLRMAGGR